MCFASAASKTTARLRITAQHKNKPELPNDLADPGGGETWDPAPARRTGRGVSISPAQIPAMLKMHFNQFVASKLRSCMQELARIGGDPTRFTKGKPAMMRHQRRCSTRGERLCELK